MGSVNATRRAQVESKPSGPAAVVLNDFAAAGDRVISLRHWESFVWELMLYSLLREEVLIQDEALVLSEKFARAFSPRPRGRILDELFDIGSLVVLSTREKHTQTLISKSVR